MNISRKHRAVIATVASAGALTGGATVNPIPVYRRPAEFIQQAIGVADVYDARGADRRAAETGCR